LSKIGRNNPKVIWEIGSRDGREAKTLSEYFSQSRIVAFEPNPETFQLVERVSSANGRITSKNLALSNQNGWIDFYKIDTARTITSWADGNPGASSLLKSSRNYPYEEYVQDLIRVQSARAEDVVNQEPELKPSVLWVDVQGSEDQVFKGFGEHLNEIDVIVVELSLKPIYENQPLAQDVLAILKNNFYFVKVLNVGEWQFDALLVNRRLGSKIKHKFYDRCLNSLLDTKYKVGIARKMPAPTETAKWIIGKLLAFTTQSLSEKYRKYERKNGNISSLIFLKLTNVKSKKAAHSFRRIAEASLPQNPLPIAADSPAISVAIPLAGKDYSNINLMIKKVVESSLNPVAEILIIHGGTPPSISNLAQLKIKVIHESEFIPHEIEKIIRTFPENRQGWVRQQIIKFLAVMESSTGSTLVCDSDTYLTHQRLWVNAIGIQQLQISHEYSEEYENHFREMFQQETKSKYKVSFVTHHQLMQKEIVSEMFGENLTGLSKWLELADKNSNSPISEYHCYGRFITDRHSDRSLYSRWNNLFTTPQASDTNELVELNANGYSSISVHRY
jgi:FkbM family methyltransferase